MRAMADYTRMDPRTRIQKLLEFNQRLLNKEESCDVFKEWDFHLDDKLVELNGRILKNENIVFTERKYVCSIELILCLVVFNFIVFFFCRESSGPRVDWTNHFRNNCMHRTIPLHNWYYIFPGRCGREANTFLQTVQDAARGMQFSISRPQM